MKSLAIAVVLLIPSMLFAWGGDGHQIVALIAEERLTPEAKHEIHELLGADVNISDAEIASWADNIRREKRSTGPWHYVDIPTTQPSFDEDRDTFRSSGANVGQTNIFGAAPANCPAFGAGRGARGEG